MVKFGKAEIVFHDVDMNEQVKNLLGSAKEVMDLLEKYGASIVPHIMDTDENAGQRLRDAIEAMGDVL